MLLNSFFLKSYTIVNIDPRYIKQVPLPFTDFIKIKFSHDEIVKNVDLLLKLNEELKTEKLQTKIQRLQQQ